jgi:hypothetical protein
MEGIFEIIKGEDNTGVHETIVRLGIRVNIAGQETLCAVTKACKSYEALAGEVEVLQAHLGQLKECAKEIFGKSSMSGRLPIRSDMEPHEIWPILSAQQDEELFIEAFNGLDVGKRKEVAEYVFSQCSVFSGKGQVFSSRYNSETAFLE